VAPSSTLTTTVPPTTASAPPEVDAQAYAVLDATSGALLASRDGDGQRSVGSLMKLLTAYVSYRAGRPGKVVTAPEELLVSLDESAIGIYPGEELRRDVLIRALLIVSANDAARALAVDVAGSEEAFAEQMTAAARSLGLADTRAANATGLDARGQHSSANDMVALGAMLMENPTFRQTVARHDATLHGAVLPATNDWLQVYAGANGIKTGYTTGAGWCILASAQRGGRLIVTAVLGAPSEPARNAAATALIDWAFAN
jgi:D-alanyl-D-alanine carboxypeptidase